MTFEAARLAITGRLDAAVAAYPGTAPQVQAPNRNLIDTTTQVDPFVGLDIVNITGAQLDIGIKPLAAQYGQIVLTAFCKENSGMRAATLLLDYFLPWFEMKDIGIVRTYAGMATKHATVKGWDGYPITIPFWWVRVAT